MTGIVLDFPLILYDHFVDLSLVRLHFRNPFNSHTRFRLRGHGGSSRRRSSLQAGPTFGSGMMALVQIREREERR